MKIIKRSGLSIPAEYKNERFYIEIKEHLERRTRAYGNSVMQINTFYLESEKFLLIPRNFPLQNYLSTYNYEIEDHRHDGQIIDIEHNITPRSTVQEKAIDYLMNNENGILQLGPGVGKTVITIYMIAERKRKSLILVHRDPLAEQWKNRLLQFTNIKEDEIARLTSATFEEDLQKSIIISTTQTYLSLLKRHREDFLIKLNEANIGIFVGDEVHTSVGAPTFSECSIHMPSKYTYGLSATPYRHDGNVDIIKYHLGDIFSDKDAQGTMDAKVTVFLLDYEIDTPYRTTYIRWGGEFQRSRYLNLMRKSKPFVEVVRGLLTTLSKGRNFICVCERIKLIEDLHKWLPSKSKAMFCGKGGLETLDYKHTFATPGKCRDGVDAPWKDTAIMTSPIANIEQLAGRVTRTSKNKKDPVVVDMVDYGCKDIAKTYHRRLHYYNKKGWDIQYILYISGNLMPIDQEFALSIINKGEI